MACLTVVCPHPSPHSRLASLQSCRHALVADSPDAIAAAVLAAYYEPTTWAQLVAAGRQLVTTAFSASRAMAGLLRALAMLQGEGGGGAPLRLQASADALGASGSAQQHPVVATCAPGGDLSVARHAARGSAPRLYAALRTAATAYGAHFNFSSLEPDLLHEAFGEAIEEQPLAPQDGRSDSGLASPSRMRYEATCAAEKGGGGAPARAFVSASSESGYRMELLASA